MCDIYIYICMYNICSHTQKDGTVIYHYFSRIFLLLSLWGCYIYIYVCIYIYMHVHIYIYICVCVHIVCIVSDDYVRSQFWTADLFL